MWYTLQKLYVSEKPWKFSLPPYLPSIQCTSPEVAMLPICCPPFQCSVFLKFLYRKDIIVPKIKDKTIVKDL